LSYKYIDIRPNPVTGIGSYQRGFSIKAFVDLPQVEHRRIGGPYKATFRIYADDRNLAEDMLFLGVGREVKIYNDKGIVDFGGMVYTVTLSTGGSRVRSSLLETSNRVWARWQEAGTANPPDRSAVFNNTTSQGLYGVKEEVWNAGQQVSIAEASQYAEKQLAQSAWPTPRAIEISPGKKLADRPILEFVCYGWWHTLSHVRYNQTVLSGGINASALVGKIIGATIPAPDTIFNNLISWWTLDEDSAGLVPVARVDSHGTNDLADAGTTESTDGKVKSAGNFVPADLTYLSIADNATLSFGNEDFTLCAWAYLDATPDHGRIAGKWDSAANDREYLLYFNDIQDRFYFSVSSNGIAVTNAIATTLGAPALATWYFIVAWHDSIANTINIQVNDGGVDSVAHAAGCNDNISPFVIGADSVIPDQLLEGRADEVALWRRVLTAAERTALYNGGSGVGYDELGDSITGDIGQFIRSADIQANGTQIEQTIDADMGADTLIKSIVDMGDASLNTWVAGVDHTREFYYRRRELEN
jgi:hypothetical protein